jgi:hypothetical protein
MSDLNFLEGVSETKRRFLSDKRPSHVFCELKTPDTIPNCETLVNAVRPGDSDSRIAIAGAHASEKHQKKFISSKGRG